MTGHQTGIRGSAAVARAVPRLQLAQRRQQAHSWAHTERVAKESATVDQGEAQLPRKPPREGALMTQGAVALEAGKPPLTPVQSLTKCEKNGLGETFLADWR